MNESSPASAGESDKAPPTAHARIVEAVQEYALRMAFSVDYAAILEGILRQSLERSKTARFLDVQSGAETVAQRRRKVSW